MIQVFFLFQVAIRRQQINAIKPKRGVKKEKRKNRKIHKNSDEQEERKGRKKV